MQQQVSVITLGVADLARSKRFYAEGFGWTPVFENAVIAATLDAIAPCAADSLDIVLDADRRSRAFAADYIRRSLR